MQAGCNRLPITSRENGDPYIYIAMHTAGGSVKVTCVCKMADAAALYCVFYLY